MFRIKLPGSVLGKRIRVKLDQITRILNSRSIGPMKITLQPGLIQLHGIPWSWPVRVRSNITIIGCSSTQRLVILRQVKIGHSRSNHSDSTTYNVTWSKQDDVIITFSVKVRIRLVNYLYMYVGSASDPGWSGGGVGGGGQETWNIRHCGWRPSFLWLVLIGTGGGGHGPPPDPQLRVHVARI